MNRGFEQPVEPVAWSGIRAVGELAEWAHSLTVVAAGLALAALLMLSIRLGVVIAVLLGVGAGAALLLVLWVIALLWARRDHLR